jgi:hypothetical protein
VFDLQCINDSFGRRVGRDPTNLQITERNKVMSTPRGENRERKSGVPPATVSKIGTSNPQKNDDQSSGNQEAEGEDFFQHAKKATGEIVTQVQQRAGSQLDQQKDRAASEITSVVNAVRKFGESLAGEEPGPIARYAAEYGDKAADSLERFSNYLREQDAKKLLGDMKKFGKRRPALLLGSAFLLGFAGARLIKTALDDDDLTDQSNAQGAPLSQPSTMNASVNV